jgi:hypothetical protein
MPEMEQIRCLIEQALIEKPRGMMGTRPFENRGSICPNQFRDRPA